MAAKAKLHRICKLRALRQFVCSSQMFSKNLLSKCYSNECHASSQDEPANAPGSTALSGACLLKVGYSLQWGSKWNGQSATQLIWGFSCLTSDNRSIRVGNTAGSSLRRPAAPLPVSQWSRGAFTVFGEKCLCGASCWCKNMLGDSINKLLQRPSLASLLNVIAPNRALHVLKKSWEYTAWSRFLWGIKLLTCMLTVTRFPNKTTTSIF